MELDKWYQTHLTPERESLGEVQLEQVQLFVDGGSVVRMQGSILQLLEDSSENILARWASLSLMLFTGWWSCF